MMIEVEAKLRLTDPPALHEKLKAVQAVRDRQMLETNTYFDQPDGQLKTSDQGLRVRVELDKLTGKSETLLTHKGARAHGRLKSRSETEVGVSDPRAAAQMLSVLGYAPVLTFEKRRTRYLLDGCRVEIDTLPYLGTFVEIEGSSDDDVIAVQDKLGLADQPLIRASYIAMLTTYLREHHITDSVIRLDDDQPAVATTPAPTAG
ncbi:MAG: class IV adenylate cyclase [Planctomycetota bacterium]